MARAASMSAHSLPELAAPLPVRSTVPASTSRVPLLLNALMAKNAQQLIDGSFTSTVQRIVASGWRVIVLAAIVGAEVTAVALVALISASRGVTEFIYFNF